MMRERFLAPSIRLPPCVPTSTRRNWHRRRRLSRLWDVWTRTSKTRSTTSTSPSRVKNLPTLEMMTMWLACLSSTNALSGRQNSISLWRDACAASSPMVHSAPPGLTSTSCPARPTTSPYTTATSMATKTMSVAWDATREGAC